MATEVDTVRKSARLQSKIYSEKSSDNIRNNPKIHSSDLANEERRNSSTDREEGTIISDIRNRHTPNLDFRPTRTEKEIIDSLHLIIELLHTDLGNARKELEEKIQENDILKQRLIEQERRTKFTGTGNDSWREPRHVARANKTLVNQPCFSSFNKFELLSEEKDDNTPKIMNSGRVKIENVKRPKSRKLLIYADSHGRGLGTRMSTILGATDVCGTIKPNAPLEEVVKSTVVEAQKLKPDDCVLILGGTNSLAKNEGPKVLSSLREILPKLSHTKVLVANIPHRYDLTEGSCVNIAINECNSKIERLCRHFKHVQLINVNMYDRQCYTTHGFHLNYKGKAEVINHISKYLSTNTVVKNVIPLAYQGN